MTTEITKTEGPGFSETAQEHGEDWPVWAGPWLAAYARTAHVTDSCRRAGIDESASPIYKLRQRSPSFAKAMKEAERLAAMYLESVAVKRATEGTTQPVLYQGKPVFVWYKDGKIVPQNTKGATRHALMETKYSDRLLSQLLGGFRPDRYRPRPPESQPQATQAPVTAVQVILTMPDNGRRRVE
jgi:hypothetical protein